MLSKRELEATLMKQGYVVVPFFSEEDLVRLESFYKEVHPASEIPGTFNGIHMTTWSPNKEVKEWVRDELRKIFKAPVSRYFENHRAINHVFIIKESGSETEFNVHQDWSVVDESKHYSVNIWAPLHDVDENNGALWILPGSHRINQPVRGAGVLFPDYREALKPLWDKIKPIALKRGEALIFFHSTIHGSPPNTSGKRRVVAVNSIVPQNAELQIHFQKDNESEHEVYQPEDDFVYNYQNIREESKHKPPSGLLVNISSSYKLKEMTTEMLREYTSAS